MDHYPPAPSRPRTGSGWVYRAEGLPNYSGGPAPELHRLPYSPHSSKCQNCGAPHAILFPFATLGQTLRTVNTVDGVQDSLHPAGGTPQNGGYLEGFGSHSNDEGAFQMPWASASTPTGASFANQDRDLPSCCGGRRDHWGSEGPAGSPALPPNSFHRGR